MASRIFKINQTSAHAFKFKPRYHSSIIYSVEYHGSGIAVVDKTTCNETSALYKFAYPHMTVRML